MKLSPEEKEIILQKRIEQEALKPIKEGFLIHNYYRYDKSDLPNVIKNYKSSIISQSERDQILRDIQMMFEEPTIPAQTKFECYLKDDGQEEWFDTYNGYLECKDALWAEENLENIKDLRKGKKNK